jgi:hypothetical protein
MGKVVFIDFLPQQKDPDDLHMDMFVPAAGQSNITIILISLSQAA